MFHFNVPRFSLKRKKLAQIKYKEESVKKINFYLGFYFTLPKRFKSITPETIKINPTIP